MKVKAEKDTNFDKQIKYQHFPISQQYFGPNYKRLIILPTYYISTVNLRNLLHQRILPGNNSNILFNLFANSKSATIFSINT